MITTDIDYPEGLPNPLRSNHGVRHAQPFTRTGMATGRARQRRSFTSVPSIQQFMWLFAENEAAAFEIWFKESIQDGADWFNIRRLTPLGMSTLVCRFAEMYQGPDLVGRNHWQVTASLEVYERPLMPPGWGLLPDYIIGASIFDIAMNRQWPEDQP
ncbi:hypothetical protein [uncultured Castellaniella sp.]|uniref:hypothetical protein n=1 Tax=uncultured Castellaniella sp. TaxID=647907 RepID=UPI002608EBF7|nr:hypothetical protein [uncultured Castellaniella sp.]